MNRLIITIFIAVAFIRCNDNVVEVSCSTPATVVDLTGLDGCGYVFELEDGTRLEILRMMYCGTPPLPKEVTEDPLYNFEFVDGKKVFIDYDLVEGYGSICMVGKIAKITCIQEAKNQSGTE